MGLPRCLPNFLGTRTTLGQVVSNVIVFSSGRFRFPRIFRRAMSHKTTGPANVSPAAALVSRNYISHHLAGEPNRMEPPFSCWWNGHVLQIPLVYHVRSSMLICKSEIIRVFFVFDHFAITICLVRFVLTC